MNLPTLIVLLLVAAALILAVWLHRRSGRKLTDCGCDAGSACKSCKGCALRQQESFISPNSRKLIGLSMRNKPMSLRQRP